MTTEQVIKTVLGVPTNYRFTIVHFSREDAIKLGMKGDWGAMVVKFAIDDSGHVSDVDQVAAVGTGPVEALGNLLERINNAGQN
jgi:hypothetical protein